MKLSKRTILTLAEMICGAAGMPGFEWPNFPYRSSSHLTEFFTNCDMDYEHDGSTRKLWVEGVLKELNGGAASNPQLMSDGLIRVIQELMDPYEYGHSNKDRLAALQDLNNSLSRDGIQAYFDGAGRCHLRNDGSQATSASMSIEKRTWTSKELGRRNELSKYLDNVSEDELIKQFLHPLFRQLGFIRISVTGHKDKLLEYGNDLWMKYQLPTNHYIYFGTQVKITKIDAAGRSKNNIGEILNQIGMLLKSPVWDPETNKRNLLDHVYIISANEITKQAKNFLAQHLDTESRRHILFMDRGDILDLAININFKLVSDDSQNANKDDDLPF